MIIFARRPIIVREGVLAAVWSNEGICVMRPSHMVISAKSLAPSPLQSTEAPRTLPTLIFDRFLGIRKSFLPWDSPKNTFPNMKFNFGFSNVPANSFGVS